MEFIGCGFGEIGIKNVCFLYDETMIWKQILLKTG